MLKKVRAFAPASVANVGPGFDVLGFPFPALGDEIEICREASGGARIVAIEGIAPSMQLSFELEKNTAGMAILSMIKTYSLVPHMSISLFKGMPLGSGMGSSAASAVAAVVAVNRLFELGLTPAELIVHALEGEKVASGTNKHADNVAPSLMGQFMAIREVDPLDIVPIPTQNFKNYFCVVVHPQIHVNTQEARKLLASTHSMATITKQMGSLATLIVGLMSGEESILKKGFRDYLATPARSGLIPGYHEIERKVMELGGLGFGISGSGPSVFMFAKNQEDALKFGKCAQGVFAEKGIPSEVYCSSLDLPQLQRAGAVVILEE
jgi:homoserine kinase